jgi:hypothetical protein
VGQSALAWQAQYDVVGQRLPTPLEHTLAGSQKNNVDNAHA